jgi:succinate dehydrogenase / fumarate reductase, cytochrome b subunit
MALSTKLLSSSIGSKIIMGITGLFLISFLVVHCSINALIFVNDGGVLFNEAAEFMATNILIRTMEIVLFFGIIWHVIQALRITLNNNKARPVKYAVQNANANSRWYSRWMGLLGTLILMFLVVHLRHFWVVSRFTDEITSGQDTLFNEMKEVFENPFVVLLYVLAMCSLAYHLLHGFQSAFRTLGFNHKTYTPIIEKIGIGFSVIVPLIFAAMPIAIHFKLIQ